ncbi:hypothetical protein H181DRAFT_02299 [Streptomyces sp. WMMB 714]|uniref:hypothetical protein n=1 Tax=Streptomyces sp. WMMB 714 TaxID=1286822 RepID=UPI0005F87C6F|nr:hypothetical protein [Streptomyces sp. WMMB 714]SCK29286.1 hypothetical protein H181DRAFT_02299 [Streptomyces sp. WMMB 714]
MNPRITRRPAAVLVAAIAATAALTLTAGCDGKSKDCDKRDKGAPTQTTFQEDAKSASLTKTSGGTSGSRGGTTSGGNKGGKGGTTNAGLTAGHGKNNGCDD